MSVPVISFILVYLFAQCKMALLPPSSQVYQLGGVCHLYVCSALQSTKFVNYSVVIIKCVHILN